MGKAKKKAAEMQSSDENPNHEEGNVVTKESQTVGRSDSKVNKQKEKLRKQTGDRKRLNSESDKQLEDNPEPETSKGIKKPAKGTGKSPNAKIGKAKFTEDEEVMEMEVKGKGFRSDGELAPDDDSSQDSSDDKTENESETDNQEQEQISEGSDDNNKDQSMPGESESETSARSRSTERKAKKRCRQRHRNRRRRRISYSDSDLSTSCSRSRSSRDRSRSRRRGKSKCRKSDGNDKLQKQVETLSQTVLGLQSLVEKSGILRELDEPVKKKQKTDKGLNNSVLSNSDTTIYCNILETQAVIEDKGTERNELVERADSEIVFNFKNRGSTSSDDVNMPVDTSDELINIDCDKFIAECSMEADKQRRREGEDREDPFKRSGNMIREAEGNPTRVKLPPGKQRYHEFLGCARDQPLTERVLPANLVDEEYMVIGGHVDAGLQEKIINFEYVDFSKLIPRDRVAKIEDQRMELVMRGGATYFAPVSDRDATSIGSFTKWEQAFRIYSNILTRVYPAKALELIQYNHTIYTAALTFVWENVYQYDREFRLHISKFPQRSWSVILHQAWSMYLKDRVKVGHNDLGGNSVNSPGQSAVKIKEPCHRYNKGHCSMGAACKYEHRCAIKKCGKFGHGAHICQLRNRDKDDNGHSGSGASTSHGNQSHKK